MKVKLEEILEKIEKVITKEDDKSMTEYVKYVKEVMNEPVVRPMLTLDEYKVTERERFKTVSVVKGLCYEKIETLFEFWEVVFDSLSRMAIDDVWELLCYDEELEIGRSYGTRWDVNFFQTFTDNSNSDIANRSEGLPKDVATETQLYKMEAGLDDYFHPDYCKYILFGFAKTLPRKQKKKIRFNKKEGRTYLMGLLKKFLLIEKSKRENCNHINAFDPIRDVFEKYVSKDGVSVLYTEMGEIRVSKKLSEFWDEMNGEEGVLEKVYVEVMFLEFLVRFIGKNIADENLQKVNCINELTPLVFIEMMRLNLELCEIGFWEDNDHIEEMVEIFYDNGLYDYCRRDTLYSLCEVCSGEDLVVTYLGDIDTGKRLKATEIKAGYNNNDVEIQFSRKHKRNDFKNINEMIRDNPFYYVVEFVGLLIKMQTTCMGQNALKGQALSDYENLLMELNRNYRVLMTRPDVCMRFYEEVKLICFQKRILFQAYVEDDKTLVLKEFQMKNLSKQDLRKMINMYIYEKIIDDILEIYGLPME